MAAHIRFQLGRVQMIRQEKAVGGGNCLRRLDLGKGVIREAVLEARTDEDLNYLFENMGQVEG